MPAVRECLNPYCVCHQVEPPARPPFVYSRDRENSFRSALSKLRNGRAEIVRLGESGMCSIGEILDNLDEAIADLVDEQTLAAARYGFKIISGIGHEDHETYR